MGERNAKNRQDMHSQEFSSVMLSECKGQIGNHEVICKSILQHTICELWEVTMYQLKKCCK